MDKRIHLQPFVMIKLLSVIAFLFIGIISVHGQTVLELDGSQSMCVTGKGPGQDGAINPYSEEDSLALVKNIGENNFEIRIQVKGEIVKIIAIKPGQKKEIKLEKGYELYIDSDLKSMAQIDFKKISG